MKHKLESATSDSASLSNVRRSLSRAGLQLGQLGHVVTAVTGALGTLQSSANPRGAAQNRMRALLNQDRALLSHRACGQASLETEDENEDELALAEVAVKGSQTRTAAQNRMRELLNQDRAMLALREARRRENPASEPLDDDFAAELVQLVDREWNPMPETTSLASATPTTSTTESSVISTSVTSVARGSCVGVTASFVAEPEVSAVCTPGPLAVSAPEPVSAPKPAFAPFAPKARAAAAPAPAPSPRPVAAAESEGGGDPIRTRGMAKLLALQGYRDRALSIYDELLALEPDNAELRAEADRLRN